MSELTIEKQSTPKISVIVPVYNVEKYIHQCIDSILGQTFADFELLLINDGSKDKSGEICESYAANDSRIRVIHIHNSGVSYARNVGIRASQGEWIVFIDSDDWICNNYFENMIRLCKKFTAIDLIVNKGAINRASEYTSNYIGFLKSSEAVTQCLNMSFTSSLWLLFVNAQLLKHLLLNEAIYYWEDYLFTFHLVAKSNTIYINSEKYYYYRFNNEGINLSVFNQKKLSCLQIPTLISGIDEKLPSSATDRLTIHFLLNLFVNFIRSDSFESDAVRILQDKVRLNYLKVLTSTVVSRKMKSIYIIGLFNLKFARLLCLWFNL